MTQKINDKEFERLLIIECVNWYQEKKRFPTWEELKILGKYISERRYEIDIKLPKPQHEYGYTTNQIKSICKEYKINLKKFWSVFGINTCMLDEKLGSIFYIVDVERTLAIILKYRKVSELEWD